MNSTSLQHADLVRDPVTTQSLCSKGWFILHRNCVAVPIYRLLSAVSHRSITTFQVKMNLIFSSNIPISVQEGAVQQCNTIAGQNEWTFSRAQQCNDSMNESLLF